MTDIPAPSEPAKIAAGFSIRRFLGVLHLWTGIIFCIPFVALGLTGSLLMIYRGPPQPFVENTAAATYKPVAEIIAAARTAVPDGRVAVAYDVPSAAGEPAAVRFAAPRREGSREAAPSGPLRPGAFTRVTVDPVTLGAQVETSGGPGLTGFPRWMHDLHSAMLMAMPAGRQVVGWLGVFMCGLGLSGLVMWWPRKGQWKQAFKIRFSGSGLRLARDLHGAVGIWAWVVFLIVCFSGVYIVFPQTINAVVDAGPQVRDLRNQNLFPVTPVADATPLDVDGVVQLAKAAVPGGVMRGITLPAAADQPYRVTLSRIGDYDGKPRATVIVDPWQNKVLEVRDPEAYGAVDKYLVWQRQLHAGNGLGLWWWTLVFLSGFLPPTFVTSGLIMYVLKRRNKRRVAQQA